MQLRITLDQWRALVAVVDHGSYAAAAEALHKSQSSVTYAVQKLESLLGVSAFTIEGRKSVLTPTGQLLYRRARVLLDEAIGLETSARSVSAGWEAEIGIAAEVLFPNRLLLRCLDLFGRESPHTRIELIESVLAGTTEALVERRADLAISGQIPQGMSGDSLVQLRAVLVAHPAHPLHQLGRAVTPRDLRTHRQLVVRESDAKRATRSSVDTAQRWTVSNLNTSLLAASMGYGFGWFPVENIVDELSSGALKALPLRDGRERFVPLYLVYADRENAGPGVLRLAQIIRDNVATECARIAALSQPIATRPKRRTHRK
ncbi:MAG: LysR family transcriptional regulator [Betaproteobacteria bacterium]